MSTEALGNGSGEQPGEPAFPSIAIAEEMRRSYLDYAMSVIVSRALPDVRDGLKPVHRRILYAMHENSYDWNRAYRKSARVVGDVMGKYHPHGDSAIYDAMVRMAQAFSMRLTLIDGQGNFGSLDGDPPAAMRYTEVRMARSASTLLEDIDLDTVAFQDNYDSSASEPVVLPARFPNLLVNGTGGIAVGMATNVPPHNLAEVTDAALALIDDPGIGLPGLLELVPGPDFPTGGLIMGRKGIRDAYATGRGSVVMRGRTRVEEGAKGRESIIVTEVPYQVNKARMIEQIAEGVREKRIEGVSALRDESDREGVRVVVELKREATPSVVLNQLHKYTSLQTTFGVNMLALRDGTPVQLNLKEVLEAFLAFREEVVTRRTRHLLAKARARAQTLLGLAVAVVNIDEVVALIRKAADAEEARAQLVERAWPAADIGRFVELIADPSGRLSEDGTYRLSPEQAKAILDLRLHRLTGLERNEIGAELEETADRIADHLEILRSRDRVLEILRSELREVREAFASERRTEIVEGIEVDADLDDLIEREDMVVTLTRAGYVKRTPLAAFRSQRRGGKGRTAMAVKDDDFVARVFNASTHDPILFFTDRGMVYQRKVYHLPPGTPQARGRPMVNVLPLEEGEVVTTVMPWPASGEEEPDLVFATRSGTVRRNRLSDFASIKANGKIAMKLREGDSLIEVAVATGGDDVLLSTSSGQAVRFPVAGVRVFSGRSSMGVRGVRLGEGDEVIGMTPLRHTEADAETRAAYLRHAAALRRGESPPEGIEAGTAELLAGDEEFILTVTEGGFGKRTSSHEYRVTARGGVGVRNIRTSERNGRVVGSFPVADEDEILLATDAGRIIRCPVRGIRIAGRDTQGVLLFRINDAERVVSVTLIEADDGGGDAPAPNGAAAPEAPGPAVEAGEGPEGNGGDG